MIEDSQSTKVGDKIFLELFFINNFFPTSLNQVFNEINARKLKKTEINVFQGFFRNPLFLFVIIGTVFVQLLIVEYGGKAVNCSPLTSEQNIQCIMIGLTSLVWGWVLKKLPEKLYLKFKLFNDKIKAEAPVEEEDEDEDVISYFLFYLKIL